MNRYIVRFGLNDLPERAATLLSSHTTKVVFEKLEKEVQEALDHVVLLQDLEKEEGVTICRPFYASHKLEIKASWDSIPEKYSSLLELIDYPSDYICEGQPFSEETFDLLIEEEVSHLINLDYSSEEFKSNQMKVVRPILGDQLADIMARMESKKNVSLGSSFMIFHPKVYCDLRKFGRDILEVESRTWVLRKNLSGKIWGYPIVLSSKIPENVILIRGRTKLGDPLRIYMKITSC